ncbi:MAG: hypothetical protein LBH70_01290 [Spirochaetaceae bacterium]|jgi:hypothetical protein|nr:hypothetical protein [Spirochaetaceae bacterium]
MRVFSLILVFLLSFTLFVAGQEVLRGEVRVDLEPVYARYIEEFQPPDAASAQRAALEEAAMLYSAMIYGWSFDYEIGEKARGIPEVFTLEPLGIIPFGDPGLKATDAEIREMRLYLWTDYQMTDAQKRRMRMWRTGTIRNVQAMGKGPLGGPIKKEDWIAIKKAALEDAARAGVREMLRGMERNRPKEARGYIALAEFPFYWIDSGYWTVSARFRVELTALQPFAAY